MFKELKVVWWVKRIRKTEYTFVCIYKEYMLLAYGIHISATGQRLHIKLKQEAHKKTKQNKQRICVQNFNSDTIKKIYIP